MSTAFALLVVYVFVAGLGTLFRQLTALVRWFMRTALSGRRAGEGEGMK